MPRTPAYLKRLPDVALTLTADQCCTVLAALCDVARREREAAAELDRPGCFARADAIRAALGARRNGLDGHQSI